MKRWLSIEYILKGIYLGLLLFIALQEPAAGYLEIVAWLVLGGLAIGLGISAVRKLREGYSAKGKLLPFLIFLLLESPELVYAGIIVGLTAGAFMVPRADDLPEWTLAACVGGGALLGYVFAIVQGLPDKWTRFGIMLAVGAALAAAGLYLLPEVIESDKQFGVTIMLGMILFYLLTFAGQAEESEVEIAAICAALGVGFHQVRLTPNFATIGFLVPLAIYYWYTTRVLPGLRVFKHAMRGMSYAKIGQHRQALVTFQRALELDPNHTLAREGLWSVHKAIDWTEVAQDKDMINLVNFDLCLERVSALLASPPAPAARAEALRLLDLVLRHEPRRRPVVQYWRAVAHIHSKEYDQAAEELASVLDPTEYDPNDPQRWSILLPAWQVALRSVAAIRQKVGEPQLAVPGRRMEAIAAVERRLALVPGDADARQLKNNLYGGLTLAEYQTALAKGGPPSDFDHGIVRDVGQAMLQEANRWQRGAEYLHIAAHGLLDQAPVLFTAAATAAEKAGDLDAAWRYYEMAVQAGKALGPKSLAGEPHTAFYTAAKWIADRAAAQGKLDSAIDHYHLYTDYERSGIETLRALANLYEKRNQPGDMLNCVRIVEHALLYDGKDKDLLERKDKYYYSLKPDELKPKVEAVKRLFDVAYCLKKARGVIDMKQLDPELLDWALHLVKLVEIVEPANVTAKLLRARCHQNLGERDDALRIMEDVWVAGRPAKFASGEDEESWYALCQRLGTQYLRDLTRPDLAIPCLVEFKKSTKSGADTLFKLGEAYEQTGDIKRAINSFEQVTAYESHPLASEAQSALFRLKGKLGA